MECGELLELYFIFITEKDFLGTNEGSFEVVHRNRRVREPIG